jgi:hypothetical protein
MLPAVSKLSGGVLSGNRCIGALFTYPELKSAW